MKNYKFRGKRIDNGEWVYGNLVKTPYGLYIIPQNIYADSMPQYSVDPETVGQYTGMNDKSGKEIFDGDIVKSQRGYSFVVEWTDDGRFLGRTANRSIAYVGQEPAVEIIGNIHSNPELMEVKA